MESYYNEYFQGKGAAPHSNGHGGDEEINTHYQASNMMQSNGSSRYNDSAASG